MKGFILATVGDPVNKYCQIDHIYNLVYTIIHDLTKKTVTTRVFPLSLLPNSIYCGNYSSVLRCAAVIDVMINP